MKKADMIEELVAAEHELLCDTWHEVIEEKTKRYRRSLERMSGKSVREKYIKEGFDTLVD